MDTGGFAWQDDERRKRIFPFLLNPLRKANLRPFRAPPSGGRRENAAFPIAKPFPRIVISSESEKSFSFAVRKSCEECGERETPCFMRLGSTVLHADGFTKENGNGERKRSLGCARDDETGSGWFLTRFQIAAIHPLSSACPSSTSSQRGGMPEGLRRAFFSYRQHYPSG